MVTLSPVRSWDHRGLVLQDLGYMQADEIVKFGAFASMVAPAAAILKCCQGCPLSVGKIRYHFLFVDVLN